MIPSMDGMLNDLCRLTDQRLIATLHDEVKRERHITLRVLLLLIVVEQRRINIDRYSSLFAYCTDQLKYSSSAAGRRIAGARCLRDYPRAWPMLFDGRLNLTTLCIIARVITQDNADEILDRAAGGTQRQVEDLAAQYGGPKPVRDRIKPLRSLHRSGTSSEPESASRERFDSRTGTASESARVSEAGSESGTGFESGSGATSESTAAPGAGVGSDAPPGVGASSNTKSASGLGATPEFDTGNGPSAKEPLSQSNTDGSTSTGSSRSTAAEEPLTYEITFRANAAFVGKLRRLQALLAADPNSQLAPIFARAIELALDRYDPKRRQARRELRRTRTAAGKPHGEALDAQESVCNSDEAHEQSNSDAANQASAETASNAGSEASAETAGNASSEASAETGGNASSEASAETAGNASSEASAETPSKAGSEASNGADNTPSAEKRNSATDRRSQGHDWSPSRPMLPRWVEMTPRRKIPQWMRDLVLNRDGHRCTYVGPDGRCPADTDLEIDHICPRAKGGSDNIDNLRTFCRAHNQRAAEIEFGTEFMRRFREERPSSTERKPGIARPGASADSDQAAPLEAVPV